MLHIRPFIEDKNVPGQECFFDSLYELLLLYEEQHLPRPDSATALRHDSAWNIRITASSLQRGCPLLRDMTTNHQPECLRIRIVAVSSDTHQYWTNFLLFKSFRYWCVREDSSESLLNYRSCRLNTDNFFAALMKSSNLDRNASWQYICVLTPSSEKIRNWIEIWIVVVISYTHPHPHPHPHPLSTSLQKESQGET
jgi:hypothetical protein